MRTFDSSNTEAHATKEAQDHATERVEGLATEEEGDPEATSAIQTLE